jgi:hypothetical protein
MKDAPVVPLLRGFPTGSHTFRNAIPAISGQNEGGERSSFFLFFPALLPKMGYTLIMRGLGFSPPPRHRAVGICQTSVFTEGGVPWKVLNGPAST